MVKEFIRGFGTVLSFVLAVLAVMMKHIAVCVMLVALIRLYTKGGMDTLTCPLAVGA